MAQDLERFEQRRVQHAALPGGAFRYRLKQTELFALIKFAAANAWKRQAFSL
jgi:hypothetical protein